MSEKTEQLLEAIAEKMVREADTFLCIGGVDLGRIRWTGWKGNYALLEKHAQLVWFPPEFANNQSCFYVDFPSMKHGPLKRGESFDVGMTQDGAWFTHEAPTLRSLQEMFKAGMLLLVEDILKTHEGILFPVIERFD